MNTLLQTVLDAHGGLPRWQQATSISATVTISGGLWTIKGHPEGLRDVRMVVGTSQPRNEIAPFGPGRGDFRPDRVWISGPDGRILQDRSDPLASFAGHVRTTPWDKLHELYFTGYAFWNYFNTPFLFTLPGVETEEIGSHLENGETWRRLAVRFPDGFPTHSRDQTFYFNQAGLLQRIDYVTDVAGGVASHYCFDPVTVSGLVFPTLRRVVQRTPAGPKISGSTAVLVLVSDLRVD
jgi:hypothetical protein